MKRLLITGSSGFIGKACHDRMIKSSFDEIHCVSRNEILGWHKANLLNCDSITDLLGSIKPTHILHAAWEVTPRTYANSPANQDWLRASVHMAKIFAKNGGQHFLGVGSSAEYKPDNSPCKEFVTAISPQSAYGKAKALFWEELQEFDFISSWARVFVPYGPGDPPLRLIPYITGKLCAGEIVETTHGQQVRDFIHTSDIAEFCAKIFEHQVSGPFNIGSGIGISIHDVIAYIANYLNRLHLVKFGAVPLSPQEPMVLIADMERSCNTLSHKPAHNLLKDLDLIIESVKSRQEKYE